MKETYPFAQLFAVPVRGSDYLTVDADGTDFDEVDTYIVSCSLNIYGLPFFDDEEECPDEELEDRMCKIYERVGAGDYSDLVKAGELYGSLILYEQMQNDGYDPYTLCDDCSVDLEYVMATLQKEGAPLSSSSEEWYRSIFYIHELEIYEDFRGNGYGSSILNALPELIFRFYHVKPDILAYYPSPTGTWITKEQREEELRVSRIIIDRAFSRFAPNAGKQNENNDGKKVLPFPDIFQTTEDDVNKLLGRKNSSSIYPEHLKNLRLIHFYEMNGFQEIDGERLWWKSTL